MKILFPRAFGMCFGVRDALAAAANINNPSNVTVYGELVHNEAVHSQLTARGFIQMPEGGREIPSTETVFITAHGVSGTERGRLAAAGLQILDTTCPLVRNAHAAALELASEGRFIVVIGRADHVEVRGLTGDLSNFTVIANEGEVTDFQKANIGVLSQTTTPPSVFEAALAEIYNKNQNANIRVMDTICRPTRDRQEGLAELLPQIDLLVVVGGRRSRNTLELVAAGRNAGKLTYHVGGAAEVDASWFEENMTVGIAAGTSTLAGSIDEVYQKISSLQFSPAGDL